MTSNKNRRSKVRRKVAKWAEQSAGADALREDLLKLLRSRRGWTVGDLAFRLKCAIETVERALSDLRDGGRYNIHQSGPNVTLEAIPLPIDHNHVWASSDGHYRFGVISDTHYGSKYAREDVVHSLYEWYRSEGISRVYHAGNWIEGEARFNKYDLLPEGHGMQAQLDYFCLRYPRIKGITTYYVTGDDHEGWYAQREGANIGQMLMDTALAHGRKDLVDLGYMEAFIRLQRRGGGSSKMLVCHPGGGSAYATSYAPQKVVESLQPGEKPGCIIFGHWHKMDAALHRGVWCVQAGCTKDVDPFARKKRLSYHVGGAIVEFRQDAGGALYDFTWRPRQFFDRGYYNDQFSHSHRPQRRRV